MFLQYFKIKRNNYKKQSLSIYQEIVNHSNHFIKNSLNDKDFNFDEVFEIFSIITVFYLRKLKDKNTQIHTKFHPNNIKGVNILELIKPKIKNIKLRINDHNLIGLSFISG